MIPFRKSKAGGAIAAATPHLSTIDVQTGLRTPQIGPNGGSNFSPTLFGKFTPGIDVNLTGLRDAAQVAGQQLVAQVFKVSDSSMVAETAPIAARAGEFVDFLFAAPVTLLAGVAYYIGFYTTVAGGQNVQAAQSAQGDYGGFTLAADSYYGNRGQAPTNTINGYAPTFSLIVQQGDPIIKNVLGPLDPVDFPVVKVAADLPVGAVALLDPGNAPPRLIRRRADGTVWYGPPFGNVP